MPAVDDHGEPALDEELVERVYGGVVRVVAVEEGVELRPEELRVLEEARGLLEEARQPRVRPDERVGALDGLDDAAHVVVVRVKDEALAVLVLAHEPHEPVPVERDVEEREVAHVHVRVEDHPTFSPSGKTSTKRKQA